MSNITRIKGYEGETRIIPASEGYSNPRVFTAAPAEPDDIAALVQFLRLFWNHKWLLILGAVVGVTAGLGMSLWTIPMYSSRMTLEIQSVSEPYALSVERDPALGTQMQLISSTALRSLAAAKLSTDEHGLVQGAPIPVPITSDPLQPLRKALKLPDTAKSIPWDTAVQIASGSARVNVVKDSSVLILSTESTNPRAASDYLNTLAREYMARNEADRQSNYQNTESSLSKARQQLEARVNQSEQNLEAFAKKNGLVIAASQNMTEEKFRQLHSALAAAMNDRITKEANYEASTSNHQESLPAVIDSGLIAGQEGQLADLRKQLAGLLTKYTPEYSGVQQIQAQIDQVERDIQAEKKNILSRYEIEFNAAKKKEDSLTREFNIQSDLLSKQAPEMVQYTALLRDVEANRTLLADTLAKGGEASIASTMRLRNAQILDVADVSDTPLKPVVPFNLTLGMLGGLFCSALFVVGRSRLDTKIRVSGTSLPHLRELGMIPSAKADRQLRKVSTRRASLPNASNGDQKSPGVLSPSKRPGLELAVWSHKGSVTAEAFRSAMTSLLFSSENTDKPQVLIVTSPRPREGKTTVISNLAVAVAEINHRVLLIDADMRLPRIHTIFDLPNVSGLSDYLNDLKSIDEYRDEDLLRKTHIPGLYVLPAGGASGNLSRLLHSGRMDDLIERFRRTFDMILIDTAPILSVPDARILSRSTDGVVLVVRAGHTHQESADAAVRCLEEDGRRILGTILNDCDPKAGKYSAYGAGYGQYGTNGDDD